MYKFRPLELSESARLKDFLYLAVHVPPGCSPPDRTVLNAPLMTCYIKDWGKPQDFGIVAETAKVQLVGVVWIRQLTASCPGYGFIDDATPSLAISVLPSFRGRGIGTGLLTKLLEQAPCDRIGLSVQNSNPAKRLYERTGFATVQKRVDESIMLWTRAYPR